MKKVQKIQEKLQGGGAARLQKSDVIHIARLLILATVLLLIWKYFAEVVGAVQALFRMLAPFLLGAAIAFVLNVPMRAIEKTLFGGKRAQANRHLRKMSRPVSLVLTLLFVLALLALFFGVLVPQLRETVEIISKSAQEFYPKAEAWVIKTFNDNPQIIGFVENLQVDWKKLASSAGDVLQDGIGVVVTSGVNAVVSLISGVVNTFIGLIFACYVLAQKEKLGDQARRIVHAAFRPRTADNLCGVCAMASETFSSFVRGQCLEAVILGVMFIIVMSIFGLPYPLLVGVIITFTALIPIFGAFIGCVISALMILMVDPVQALIFVIIFLILQQLEDNLIYPHVVGNSVGLPSIWVLVAVTVGGSLMGVVGMLVFIPLCSVAYALLREWTNHHNDLRAQAAAVQGAAEQVLTAQESAQEPARTAEGAQLQPEVPAAPEQDKPE